MDATIQANNFDRVRTFLLQFDGYNISSLLISKEGGRVIDSGRKTGFVGFMVGIRSIITFV